MHLFNVLIRGEIPRHCWNRQHTLNTAKDSGPDQLYPLMLQILAAFLEDTISALLKVIICPIFKKGGPRGGGQLPAHEFNFYGKYLTNWPKRSSFCSSTWLPEWILVNKTIVCECFGKEIHSYVRKKLIPIFISTHTIKANILLKRWILLWFLLWLGSVWGR